MRALTVLIVFLGLFGCSCSKAETSAEKGNKRAQKQIAAMKENARAHEANKEVEFRIEGDAELANQAIELFKRECPDWFSKHRVDVRDVDVVIELEVGDYDFKNNQFGWEKLAWFRVNTKERVPWMGHTFHYWLGSGIATGMFGGGKEGGRAPCNLSKVHPSMKPDAYKFREIPAAEFLK